MKPKKSGLLHSSRTKPIGKVVSRMTKSLAYIGALVVGVLLTTCVGSAWSMEVLTDEQMALSTGTACNYEYCDDGHCCTYLDNYCNRLSQPPLPFCEGYVPIEQTIYCPGSETETGVVCVLEEPYLRCCERYVGGWYFYAPPNWWWCVCGGQPVTFWSEETCTEEEA